MQIKNTKMLLGAGILALSLMVAVATAPSAVSADTATTTASIQVQNLLAQVQALQAQLAALQSLQAQIQTAKSNIGTTLSLIHSLSQGMTGSDVSTLQAILAADPTIYPSGTITGFYGKLTAEAVKKFQRKHGISTTGFVGPLTLGALNSEIENLGLSQDDNTNTTINASTTMMMGDNNKSDNGSHGQNGQGDNQNNGGDNTNHTLCVKVSPGHLIAPGWLKKEGKDGGEMQIVPECQMVPPGIMMKFDDDHHGTTTPPTGTTTPPVLDTTAPVISLLTATSTAMTGTVTWTTNELATSKMWYGTSVPFTLASSTTAVVAGFSTSHTLSVTGLATSTTYSYEVVSADASGNTATSSLNSFMTLAQ